jgi:hypothetical protein
VWGCVALAAGTILLRSTFGLMRKRYYFDVREVDDISPDDEGMELASLEAVETEAARALTEMARDTVRSRLDGSGH